MKKYYVGYGYLCSIKEVEVEKETKSFVVIKGDNYKTAKNATYHGIFDDFSEAKEALRENIDKEVAGHQKKIDYLRLQFEAIECRVR